MIWFFAQAVPSTDMLDWVQAVIQLVTAGGFGALVWYLVIKHIPHIEERHRAERAEWLSYIRERDKVVEGLTAKFLEALHETRFELKALKDAGRHGKDQ